MRALSVALVAVACRHCETADSASEHASLDWSRDDVMYEVNVRQYTAEGTFSAFAPHLSRLDSLGVDIIWFMPVQPIGKVNRKGPLGSYYSIANYTAVNPEFGTMGDFRRVIDEAHRLGMKVILDWVGNHTAFDHPWISEHPDWYAHRPDGTISFPLDQQGNETDWTDVAELNYENPAMRRAMIGEMRWWIDSMNVDGFRCDVAWGVPMDFWHTVRSELEAIKPDVFLLAESEGPEYHEAFDATYAWAFHHLLNQIARGEAPMDSLDAYLEREDQAYPQDAYRLTFTSNHDENSWQGTEFERMGRNHAPAFVLAATMEQSMPLLYTGQEDSLAKRLRFFDKDTVGWEGHVLSDFYRRLFQLKEANPALWNGAHGGDQVKLNTSGAAVYAFSRTQEENTVVVVLNFGERATAVGYSGLTPPGEYEDAFSGSRVTLGASGTVDVAAHGYRILVRQN